MSSYMSLFKIIEKEQGWVNFQIESFNHFIEHGIQNIIDEIQTVSLNPELGDHKLNFGKVHIGRPSIKEADGSTRQIFPNEARIRNLTYAAPVYVDITPIINGTSEKPERVHIGNLPIMVKSSLCSTHGLTPKEMVQKGEDPAFAHWLTPVVD